MSTQKSAPGFGGSQTTTKVVVAAPPPPPELLQALVGWRERLPEGETFQARLDALDKLITYIPTKSGVREVKKVPFGHIIREPKEILVGRIEENLPTGIVLATPKLPWELFAQTVVFFRHLNTLSRAEVLIRFFWDRQEGRYIPFVPPQEVSTGRVEVDTKRALIEMEQDHDRYVHVLDIHSHNTMSAFWSSTDDADERQAVRLYGVIGHIDRKIPMSNWRMWDGKEFINLAIGDLIDCPTVEVTLPIATGALLTSNDNKGADKVSFTYDVDPFHGVEFPKEWMQDVTVKQWTSHHYQGGGHWRRGGHSTIYVNDRAFDTEDAFKRWQAGDKTAGRPIGGVPAYDPTRGSAGGANSSDPNLDVRPDITDVTAIPAHIFKQIGKGDKTLYRIDALGKVWRWDICTVVENNEKGAWVAANAMTPHDLYVYRSRTDRVLIYREQAAAYGGAH